MIRAASRATTGPYESTVFSATVPASAAVEATDRSKLPVISTTVMKMARIAMSADWSRMLLRLTLLR